jgi:hypothetical protein
MMLILLVLLVACRPPQPLPSVEERCQASSDPALCTIVGRQVEAEQQQPAVIYQQPVYQPVYQQRPYVVIPGVAPAVRTQLPGVYAVPSTQRGGSTRFFTVQPLP